MKGLRRPKLVHPAVRRDPKSERADPRYPGAQRRPLLEERGVWGISLGDPENPASCTRVWRNQDRRPDTASKDSQKVGARLPGWRNLAYGLLVPNSLFRAEVPPLRGGPGIWDTPVLLSGSSSAPALRAEVGSPAAPCRRLRNVGLQLSHLRPYFEFKEIPSAVPHASRDPDSGSRTLGARISRP